MAEAHATQHVVGLGVLDIRVGRDLDTIAPGIQEIEEPAVEELDAMDSSVLRASGLSSTAMPKCRRVSGLRSALRMKLMNWSPK
jgi:hypothetical protein